MLAVAALLAGCGSSSKHAGPSRTSNLPALTVRSATWPQGGALAPPIGCTAADPGHSPALSWTGAPDGTTSYAVTITDTDAGFLHWAVLGLAPSVTSLDAGASPGGHLPAGARELSNSFGKPGYGGPCPPAGSRHHYVLTVWAVKGDASTVADLGRLAVASGTLTATYTQ